MIIKINQSTYYDAINLCKKIIILSENFALQRFLTHIVNNTMIKKVIHLVFQ